MAEKEVKKVEEAVAEAARTGMKKRGHYDFLSDENKAKVAKMLYSTVLLHHCDILKERPNLKESTVRGWESKHMHSVAQGKSDTDKSNFVSTFAAKKKKKHGGLSLLEEDVESQVREFIRESRASAYVVNTAVIIGAATGIVKAKDANILIENGGYLDLSKEWAQRLMTRMGLVKRKGSTAAKITDEDFYRSKEQYLTDIETISQNFRTSLKTW